MAVLPKVDVVFVGFGMVSSIIANELSKRTSLTYGRARARAHSAPPIPTFLMDHFDEWRYAVQGQLFQNYAVETCTFRNDAEPDGAAGQRIRRLAARQRRRRSDGPLERAAVALPRLLLRRTAPISSSATARTFCPADTTIQDWGITCAEIEPYYDQFDKMFGTSGKAGNLQRPDPAWRQPLRRPALQRISAAAEQTAYGPALFKAAAEQLGYQVFPSADVQQPGRLHEPRRQVLAPCNYCGFCERFGCHVGAKASPITTDHPECAQERSVWKSASMPTCVASTTQSGKATGVTYLDASGQEQNPAGRPGGGRGLHARPIFA